MSEGPPVRYHSSDLEGALSTMREALRSHAQRIAALELAARGTRAAVPSGDAPPASASSSPAPAATDVRLPAHTAALRLGGRVVIIVAGGFALRALTDSGFTSAWQGAALGLGYALAFLLAAERAAARGDRVSASAHGASTLLLAFPLLDEMMVRLHLLGPAVATLSLALVTVAALAVAVRHRLRVLAWLALSGAVVVTVFLAIQAGRLVPAATFLVGLGVGCLWLDERLDGGLRWAVAPAADLAVLILAIRSASPYAEEHPAAALGLVTVLPAVYLASFALRTILRRRTAGAFEFAQAVGAVGVAVAGATAIAPHFPSAVNWLGAAAAAVGVTAYLRAIRSHGAPASSILRFEATLGVLLLTSGSALVLPRPWAAAAWSALAVLSATLARRPGWKGLALHSAIYAWGAAETGGLLALSASVLAAPAGPGLPRLEAAALASLAAAILSIGLLATAAPPARAWPARLPRLALLVVAAAGTTGAAVSTLGPLVARLVGAGANKEVVPTLLGLVLAAGAVAFARLGQREELRDATWLAYSMLVLSAFEMVEAFPSSRPDALALALAGYGIALLLVARLRHRPRIRAVRNKQSEGRRPPSPNHPI